MPWLGGLLGGLCIVYILPHLTDIGDLAILIAAAAALCAWIATSSDLLAYAGMQMALAFFLGVLQGYGPTTELTVLRDRVFGILLGNIVMSIVFSTVWPVSAATQARKALAAASRSLCELLRDYQPRPPAGSQLRVARAINQARRLAGLGAFETQLLPPSAHTAIERQSLDAFADLAQAALVVVNQPPGSEGAAGVRQSAQVAARLSDCASRIIDNGTAAPPSPAKAVDPAATAPASAASLAERSAAEAHALLETSMERFAAYVA